MLFVSIKEATGGFLESWEIPSYRVHETVGCVLGLSMLIPFDALESGALHKFAEGRAGASGLGLKPCPLPGKERHFPGDDAKFGAAAALAYIWLELALGSRVRSFGLVNRVLAKTGSLNDLLGATVEVDFELMCCLGLEDEDRGRLVLVPDLFGLGDHVSQSAS